MTLPSPSQIINAIIRAVPSVVPYLGEATIKAAGYDSIRTVMKGEIFGAVFGYLSGTGNIVTYAARMAAAVSKAYIDTADTAYIEGGGELPLDEDTAAWAREQLDQQLSYIDDLFQTLKELRKQGNVDSGNEAQSRAEGYAGSLDALYSGVKLRGADNIVLEFGGDDGKESCATCSKLKGQRHKISWWIDNGLVPGQPGNENYECQGYNCAHILFNPRTGEEYVV